MKLYSLFFVLTAISGAASIASDGPFVDEAGSMIELPGGGGYRTIPRKRLMNEKVLLQSLSFHAVRSPMNAIISINNIARTAEGLVRFEQIDSISLEYVNFLNTLLHRTLLSMADAGVIHRATETSGNLETIGLVDRLLGYERGVPAVVLDADADDIPIAEPIHMAIQGSADPVETLSVYVKRLSLFIESRLREATDICGYFSETPRLMINAIRQESSIQTGYEEGAMRLIETSREVLGLKISRDLQGIVGLHPWLATEISTVPDEDLIEIFVPQRISRQVACALRDGGLPDMEDVREAIPELDSIGFLPTGNGLDVSRTLNDIRNSLKLVLQQSKSVEIPVYVYLLTKLKQGLTVYGRMLEFELTRTDNLMGDTSVLTIPDESEYETSAHANAPGT
jgi:hypothetical protein